MILRFIFSLSYSFKLNGGMALMASRSFLFVIGIFMSVILSCKVRNFSRNVSLYFHHLHGNISLLVFNRNSSSCRLYPEGVFVIIPSIIIPVVTHFIAFIMFEFFV